jgi:branched-chain amino acid transport system ATP-binding protein
MTAAAVASPSPLLVIDDVYASYGSVEALRGVSITVGQGEIVTLIGANGAGKTTILMTICGQPRPRRGRILFDGRDITRMPTDRIIAAGLAHSPEGRRIFARMTVFENLLIGATAAPANTVDADLTRVFGWFPVLKERANQRGGTLSGGEQQMLAIGRALMSRPRLLLLDEPSLGLAPMLVKQIFRIIRDINEQEGVTVFLVEQNAHHALRIAHRGYVLVNGVVSLAGVARDLLDNEEVRAAYLEGEA